jgi:hypothetical protein
MTRRDLLRATVGALVAPVVGLLPKRRFCPLRDVPAIGEEAEWDGEPLGVMVYNADRGVWEYQIEFNYQYVPLSKKRGCVLS